MGEVEGVANARDVGGRDVEAIQPDNFGIERHVNVSAG